MTIFISAVKKVFEFFLYLVLLVLALIYGLGIVFIAGVWYWENFM